MGQENHEEIQRASADRNADQQLCFLVGGSIALTICLCVCICVIIPLVVVLVIFFVFLQDVQNIVEDERWGNSSYWIDEDFNE